MQLKKSDEPINDNVVTSGNGSGMNPGGFNGGNDYYGDASVKERPVNFGANGPYDSPSQSPYDSPASNTTPFGASSMSGMNQGMNGQPGMQGQPGGMGQPGAMGSPYRPGQPGGMGQPGAAGSPYRPGQPSGMNGQGGYGGQPGMGGQGGYGGQPGMPGQPGGMGGSVYRGPQEPIMRKKGLNPLFIIIPIVLIVAIFFGSQFKKIFGKSEYIPGTLSEGVFTNEYFGFKADFSGSGWDTDGFSGDADSEKRALDAKQTVSELYAKNEMNIEILDFTVYQTPYNIKETGTDISSLMETYKDEYVKELEGIGYSVKSINKDTMTIAGKTCNGYVIDCDYSTGGQTVSISLVQFFVFKGNYMGYFSAGSNSGGKAKLIITNHVSALD